MTLPRVGSTAGGSTVEVRLQPRSSRRGVGGVREGALELRVGAPPVEGKANEEARRLLADLLEMPASAVDLRSGTRSRRKVFAIRGVGPAELERRLASLLTDP